MIRFAFAGFRHGHITAIHAGVERRPDTEVVAAAEEHPPTRERVAAGGIAITHDSIDRMLDAVECEVVAVGDYYGARGRIIIEALRHGRHVISDKPICTDLDELAEIERLATASGLSVIAQLDVRGNGCLRALREAVRAGRLGDVHAVGFGGQHPLGYPGHGGSRPDWYFEPGRHGGTINDIAIHAFDYIPWVVGRPFASVVAARAWNARLPEVPDFQDAAQVMLTLEGGTGVLGDVSYLMPEAGGYGLPQYWRTTVWGSEAMAETHPGADGVTLYRHAEAGPEHLEAEPAEPDAALRALVAEMSGEAAPVLTTAETLRASRAALVAQKAADEGERDVALA